MFSLVKKVVLASLVAGVEGTAPNRKHAKKDSKNKKPEKKAEDPAKKALAEKKTAAEKKIKEDVAALKESKTDMTNIANWRDALVHVIAPHCQGDQITVTEKKPEAKATAPKETATAPKENATAPKKKLKRRKSKRNAATAPQTNTNGPNATGDEVNRPASVKSIEEATTDDQEVCFHAVDVAHREFRATFGKTMHATVDGRSDRRDRNERDRNERSDRTDRRDRQDRREDGRKEGEKHSEPAAAAGTEQAAAAGTEQAAATGTEAAATPATSGTPEAPTKPAPSPKREPKSGSSSASTMTAAAGLVIALLAL